MPTADQIVDGLAAIAHRWPFIAMVWHLYFALLLIALGAGWRPSRRIVAALVVLPLFSVSVAAWLTGNPFNGLLFAVTALLLLLVAVLSEPHTVKLASQSYLLPGTAMIAFGWFYPHFLEEVSPLVYLYAAPTGLIPCPTLSLVIGVAMVLNGLGSRLFSTLLGVAGIFYGLFGAAVLDVAIDIVLLVGALLLLLQVHTHGHE